MKDLESTGMYPCSSQSNGNTRTSTQSSSWKNGIFSILVVFPPRKQSVQFAQAISTSWILYLSCSTSLVLAILQSILAGKEDTFLPLTLVLYPFFIFLSFNTRMAFLSSYSIGNTVTSYSTVVLTAPSICSSASASTAWCSFPYYTLCQT